MQIDYDLMGVFIQETKIILARSNKVDFNLVKNLNSLMNPRFPENLIRDSDVKLLGLKNGVETGSELLNLTVVKNIVQHVFQGNTKEYAELMNCFPDAQFVFHFFQMTEYRWLKRMRRLIMAGVSTNIKFQVSRKVFDDQFVAEPSGRFKWRLVREPMYFDESRLTALFEAISFEKETADDQFQIRLLAQPSIDLKFWMKNWKKPSWNPDLFNRVIIHIHGGGFIAMSSSSHLVYLTKYATEAQALVFCVDYPLAPQNKYASMVDCIFKAYLVITAG